MNAEFFFGRETFVESLVRVINQQPLVAVIGSSGSGKSSVVLAGLIPKLRSEGSWLIESFRPNKQPFYELAAALISQLEPELGKTDKTIKAKEIAQSIRQHGFTADVSAILKENPGKRLLLVVDQFEELYTGCADTEQQQFVDALLAAVNLASHAVTLVLTLRADFYSYVVNYPPFGEALNNYPAQNLSLMKLEEMQAAIELDLVTFLAGAEARLVVTGRNEATGEETVEVVHEALIREWGTLRGWMESDRTFRTWQERLEGSRRQWEITGKDDGALLRGVPLVEAESWRQKRLVELSERQRIFIQLSLALRDMEKKERESQQQRVTIARTLAICFLIAFLGLVVFFFRDWIRLAFL